MTAPTPKDVICDPAGGTAGFLVVASEHLVEHHGDRIYKDARARRRFNEGTFHGYNFDTTMLRIGSMNIGLVAGGGEILRLAARVGSWEVHCPRPGRARALCRENGVSFALGSMGLTNRPGRRRGRGGGLRPWPSSGPCRPSARLGATGCPSPGPTPGPPSSSRASTTSTSTPSDVEFPRGFGTRLNGRQDRVAVMRVWNEAERRRRHAASRRRHERYLDPPAARGRGGGAPRLAEWWGRRIDAGKRVMGWPERAGADPRTQPWPGSKAHGHAGAGVLYRYVGRARRSLRPEAGGP